MRNMDFGNKFIRINTGSDIKWMIDGHFLFTLTIYYSQILNHKMEKLSFTKSDTTLLTLVIET